MNDNLDLLRLSKENWRQLFERSLQKPGIKKIDSSLIDWFLDALLEFGYCNFNIQTMGTEFLRGFRNKDLKMLRIVGIRCLLIAGFDSENQTEAVIYPFRVAHRNWGLTEMDHLFVGARRGTEYFLRVGKAVFHILSFLEKNEDIKNLYLSICLNFDELVRILWAITMAGTDTPVLEIDPHPSFLILSGQRLRCAC